MESDTQCRPGLRRERNTARTINPFCLVSSSYVGNRRGLADLRQRRGKRVQSWLPEFRAELCGSRRARKRTWGTHFMDYCVSTSSQTQVDRDRSCPIQDEIHMQDLESQLVRALTCRREGSEMVAAADIARVCGVTERHVTNLRKRRQMPPAKQFGRVWRWHARTVARWLARSAEYDLSTAASDKASPDDRPANTNASKSRAQPRPGARSPY